MTIHRPLFPPPLLDTNERQRLEAEALREANRRLEDSGRRWRHQQRVRRRLRELAEACEVEL